MKASRALGAILLAFVLLGAGALDEKDKSGTNATDKAFLYWDVNSSLGLPGGPIPSQVAGGRAPAYRSPEEFAVLEDALRDACIRYSKTSALHQAAAIGGEGEKFYASGYALSLAQARFAWARGRVSATVARLQQAVRFAELLTDSTQAAYDAGKTSFDDSITAAEARLKARLAVDRVRHALEALGYELKDVHQQPQIDPKHPGPDDCKE